MKLADIIDQDLSLYNSLGKTGGTALAYAGFNRIVDTPSGPIDVWDRKPITEEQRGGEYDPKFAKFGNPEPSKEENTTGWAKSTGGDSVTISKKGKPTKKLIVRKTGDTSFETIDGEGNIKLHKSNGKAVTGKIDFKKMNGTHRGLNTAGHVPFAEGDITETRSGTGTGWGGSGATEHPMSGPAELEYDLTKVEDEFKGKDTRADIKTSKAKRKTLKQFLKKRTDREIE
jgi:uncharacterized protein (DUF2345 family)